MKCLAYISALIAITAIVHCNPVPDPADFSKVEVVQQDFHLPKFIERLSNTANKLLNDMNPSSGANDPTNSQFRPKWVNDMMKTTTGQFSQNETAFFDSTTNIDNLFDGQVKHPPKLEIHDGKITLPFGLQEVVHQLVPGEIPFGLDKLRPNFHASETSPNYGIEIETSQMTKYKVISQATAFSFGKKEFIFVDHAMKWNQANLFCQHKFRGYLATIEEATTMNFIKESIYKEEANRDESVWVNGREGAPGQWYYYEDRETRTSVESSYLRNVITVSDGSLANQKNCLAYSTNIFDTSRLLAANCALEKRFICERMDGNGTDVEVHSVHETHPGWLEIKDRHFKIFAERLTFDEAQFRCVEEDPSASLAVALTPFEVRQLGRYMMITRPQIDMAWLGAIHCEEEGYIFPNEGIPIPDSPTSDQDGMLYPIFEDPRPKDRTDMCITLHRRANGTIFKEVPCDEPVEGFICYRNKREKPQEIDLTCAGHRYELSAHRTDWNSASVICRRRNLMLAEPRNQEEMQCLSYMMTELGQNPLAHIWLGGSGYNSQQYNYLSDDKNVHIADNLWLQNLTIVPHLDQEYTCLNLDKMNADRLILYGTDCNFRQHFICQDKPGGAEQPASY